MKISSMTRNRSTFLGRPFARRGRVSFVILALTASVLTTAPSSASDPPPPVVPSMDGKIVFQSNASGTDDVWVMSGDGTGVTRLTSDPANLNKEDGQPSWAGDATRVVFASCRDDSQNRLPCVLGDVTDVLGNSEIYSMKSDGTSQTRLTNNLSRDASPSLSPAGTKIAFVSLRDLNPEIYVMNADGTGQTRLTNNTSNDFEPKWSPDGRRLLFVSNRTGNNEIFVMKPDGTGVTQLTSNSGSDFDPAWSPDGTEILFSSDRDGDFEIYSMNAPGQPTSLTKLTSNNVSERFPAWSPRGREIAFNSNQDGDEEIFLMNADGTGRRQVTQNTSTDKAPDWAENLSVKADKTSVAASPGSIPIQNIPLSRTSPNATGAAGDALKLDGVGLGGDAFKLDNIGLGGESLKLESIGLGGDALKLDNIGLGGDALKLDNIGLGGDALKLDNIGLGTLDGLKRIPLSSLAILNPPPTWEDVLRGTPFEGLSLNTVSLGDLAGVNDTQAPTLSDVRLAQLDLTQAPFGSIRFDALLAGKTRWRDITSPLAGGWCPRFEALGFANCGAAFKGLDGTPLYAQLAGMQFDNPDLPVPLHAALLGGITFAPDAPAPSLLLKAFDMGVTSIGSILIKDLPNASAVVDCARVTCGSTSTQTLYNASQLFPTAVSPTATLSQLGSPAANIAYGEVILALVGQYPFESVPYSQLGIGGWGGPGSTGINYEVKFAPVGVSTATTPDFTMTFPSTFLFDSSTISVAGAPAANIAAKSITRDNGALTVVWTSPSNVDSGTTAVLKVLMRPGARLGASDSSVSVSYGSTAELRTNRVPVTVTDTFEPNPSTSPATIQPNVLYSSFTLTGDQDSFALSAPARGSRVTVMLGHQAIDRDLSVFYPPGAGATPPLRTPTSSVAELPIIADEGVGFENTTTPVQPDGFEVPLEPGRRLAGFSQNRGDADEFVTIISGGGPGSFLIKVTPYANAASDEPYTLRVRVTPPRVIANCQATSFAFDADPYAGSDEATSLLPAMSTLAVGAKTLFIFPRGRWSDTFGPQAATDVTNKLTELAGHAKVKGAVIGIDSISSVRSAYQAWDANQCDPELSNDVIRQTNAYIDSLVGSRKGEIPNIVLVGDHLMTPMAANRDLTEWGNESGYTQSMPYSAANAVNSASIQGYVLSDDAWADTNPQAIPGGWLYVPDWAVGRMVEDSQDVIAAAQAFIDSNGVLDPKTAATASTDFMKDLGDALQSQHQASLTGTSTHLRGDTWTLNQLKSAILPSTARPDIAAMQLHSDGYRASAPGSSAPLATADLDAATGAISKIWYTMGCHTGELRPDRLGTAGGAFRDWAQTLARRASIFVGQTGYGLGGRNTYDLSEPILGEFSKNLLTKQSGATAMTAGQSLAVSKHSRIGTDGAPGNYLIKALSEATFYGLPMYQVGLASQPANSVSSAFAASRGGSDTAIQTDSNTGLSYADVRTQPTYELQVTPEGRYYKASGQDAQVTHARPVLPKYSSRVHNSTAVARGVTIKSYATTDQNNFDPVIAKPLTASSGIDQPTSERNGFDFPSVPAAISALDGGESLNTILGRFTAQGSTSAGQVFGRMRLVTDATWRVWYSNDPDVTAPSWIDFKIDTELTDAGWVAHFVAHVTDDQGPNHLADASVVFLDESGTWKSATLQRDGSDPTLFTATTPFSGPGIEAIGQLLDKSGNTRFLTDKGRNFSGLDKPAVPTAYVLSGPFSPYLGKTVNAGSTVPIKWTLTADGQPVTRLSAVTDLWSYQADCTSEVAIGGSATRENRSTLFIDTDGITYHYNWKTQSSFTAKCGIFELALDDGTSRQVFFRFKG